MAVMSAFIISRKKGKHGETKAQGANQINKRWIGGGSCDDLIMRCAIFFRYRCRGSGCTVVLSFVCVCVLHDADSVQQTSSNVTKRFLMLFFDTVLHSEQKKCLLFLDNCSVCLIFFLVEKNSTSMWEVEWGEINNI